MNWLECQITDTISQVVIHREMEEKLRVLRKKFVLKLDLSSLYIVTLFASVQNRIFLEWSGCYAHINETCFRLLPSGHLTGRNVLVLKFAPHFEKSWLAVLFFWTVWPGWKGHLSCASKYYFKEEIQTLCIFCMVCWPSIIPVHKQLIETFWLTYAWYVGWHNPIM